MGIDLPVEKKRKKKKKGDEGEGEDLEDMHPQ